MNQVINRLRVLNGQSSGVPRLSADRNATENRVNQPAADERDRIHAAVDRLLTGSARSSDGALTVAGTSKDFAKVCKAA